MIGTDDLLEAANVSPSFKQAMMTPHEFLSKRFDKADRRRFTDEPITGFGALSAERRREIREEEYACELHDAQLLERGAIRAEDVA